MIYIYIYTWSFTSMNKPRAPYHMLLVRKKTTTIKSKSKHV